MQTVYEALVQTEDIIDAVVLAPGHQRLAGKVSTQHDLYRRPAGTDLPNDPLHLLKRPGASVDIGAPELRRQEMVAAEDIEGQVAVAVVIAVEEPPLLAPVQGVVCGVEVQHQPLRHILVGVEKQVYEQRLDRARVNPPIAMPALRSMLETVQSRLQWRAPLPARLQTLQNRAQNRVVA